MHRRSWLLCLLLASTFLRGTEAGEPGLVGRWPLDGDARDASGLGNHGEASGVGWESPGPDGRPRSAASFDGRRSVIRIPPSPSLDLGRDDFTLAVWAHTDAKLDDILGDLASRYDPTARRGFTWGFKSGAGATNSQANDRNLQLGIDSGTEPAWADRGRPGNAVYVMAMAVHDGALFVGTCEAGEGETGHVYRHDGGTRWVDCGSPDSSNAVTSLAVFEGKLYAGTGRYRLAGSSLPESTNAEHGGQIFRRDDDGSWLPCGRLPGIEAVGGMAVYRGDLYASSLYKPAGFFRYAGGRDWEACPLPPDGRRVIALGVHNGHLYAGSYDGCTVARFDGRRWEDLGALLPSGQSYSFETASGALHVGTWPDGQVFRLDPDDRWTSTGRLGQELEVMGMAVHNGKLYAGTLPLAAVYRYDGDGSWTSTGRLDLAPDVRYRRAWSMAVFQGRLFCGTLPSGRVHALEVGRGVSLDRPIEPGWRHLAAVREGGRLRLHVDGALVASSDFAADQPLDLTCDRPLLIGLGATDHFLGKLSDFRLYNRALNTAEIETLASRASP